MQIILTSGNPAFAAGGDIFTLIHEKLQHHKMNWVVAQMIGLAPHDNYAPARFTGKPVRASKLAA